MKCMLLLWIATLLNICHADTIANSPPDEEVTTFAQQARQKAEQYFDFKTGYFKPNITEQQKQQFYNDLLDSLVTTKEELYRFDRRELQPFISEPYRKKQELAIQKMADTCVQYIGVEPQDKDNNILTLKQGETVITTYLNLPATKDSKEVLKHIQNNYLQGRIYKCSHFLYGDHYSLADFEFYDYAQPKTVLFRKRQMLESLYEDLYLAIRKAGLLRTIPAMHYPKSLIRNHADNKGLTQYINKQQKIASKKLNHEELAIQFFGSYDKWIDARNLFFNTRDNRPYANSYYFYIHTLKLCANEIGKIGLNVLYTETHGGIMRIHELYLGRKEPVKCLRRITPNEVLDFRDALYVRMNNYFHFNGYESKFYPNATEAQRQQFFQDYYDSRVETLNQLYRFDRNEKQPMTPLVIDPPATAYYKDPNNRDNYRQQQYQKLENYLSKHKKRYSMIRILLDKCSSLIGIPPYEDKRHYGMPLMESVSNEMYDLDFFASDAYQLDGKTYQCWSFLYGKNYDLTSFDYPTKKQQNTPLYKKKQQIEELYQESYLRIKVAGLLLDTPAAYYPKSLVRAHADQTGLTQFINEQEKLAGKSLKHDELAIKFFKLRKKWIDSLDEFISVQAKALD